MRVYDSCSVMRAWENGETDSYCPSTETFEELRYCIDMDFDGLQEDVPHLIGGEELRVNPARSQGDMTSVADSTTCLLCSCI